MENCHTYAQVLKKETHELTEVNVDEEYTSWNDIVPIVSEYMFAKDVDVPSKLKSQRKYHTKLDVILDENGTLINDIMNNIREVWGLQGFMNKDGTKSFANIVSKYIEVEEIALYQDDIENTQLFSDTEEY